MRGLINSKQRYEPRERVLIAVGMLAAVGALAAVMGVILWFYLQSGLYAASVGAQEELVEEAPDFKALRAEVGSYTVPEGFEESIYDAGGYTVVSLFDYGRSGRANTGMSIALVAYPEEAADYPATAEMVARDTGEASIGTWDVRWGLVEEETVVVAGRTVLMKVMEGVNGQGDEYHSCRCVYQGATGPVWVMIAGPVEGWDEEVAEAFLGSLAK